MTKVTCHYQIALVALIFFAALISAASIPQVFATQKIASPVHATAGLSLGQVFNADGTLTLKSGLPGGFDAQGYQMSYNPGGAPVFATVAAGDENWSQFDINGQVATIAVSGSDVYVGGSFTTAGGLAVNNIAKWNGSTWSALGDGVTGIRGRTVVTSIAISGNDVYVGGEFTTAGGVAVNNIAKWNGSAWSALGSGLSDGILDAPVVSTIAVSGSDVYVGGGFRTAGGSASNSTAKWNGSTWSTLGSSSIFGTGVTPFFVSAIAVSGSDVYAGGYFATGGGNLTTPLAKWNGSTWKLFGDGFSPGYLSSPAISVIAVNGGDVYVGGSFKTVGGVTANDIAKWNGTNWSSLGDGVSGSGILGTLFHLVSAITVSGSDVYIGGNFTKAGGVAANSIAKWNGSTWSALGSGVTNDAQSGIVDDVAIFGTNIYVGGTFTTAGGKPSKNFAIYHAPANATSVSAASYQPGAAPDQIVSAFGAKLATSTEIGQTFPLPTSLAGTTVTVKDSNGVIRPAPLFFVSPPQVNYLIPTGTALGPATVSISSRDGSVAESTVNLTALAPGLFSANADGQGVAAAQITRVKANGTQSDESVARFDPAQNKMVAVPIDFVTVTDRLFLILYGTGIRTNSGLANIRANIGGVDVPVAYAGAQDYYVGLDQINIELPRSLIGRGEVDVTLTIDSKTTNTVTITMK